MARQQLAAPLTPEQQETARRVRERDSRKALVWCFLFAVAGLGIHALAPTAVIEVHRDNESHVSADVSWRVLWDLVPARRRHVDHLIGSTIIEVARGSQRTRTRDAAEGNSVLALDSPDGVSLRTQLIGRYADASDAERRIAAFVSCIHCDAASETVQVPGLAILRWAGLGMFLFGGTLVSLGLPAALLRARQARGAQFHQP